MSQKLTLKQIALHFNVSITTVSKALNDSYDIGEETKKKIQKYAKKFHYTRNHFAVNLQNKETKTIGIIIPNILNNYFAKAFIGIEKVATANGYQIIACLSNESLEKEINAVESLKNRPLDGLILSLSEETQAKKYYDHLNNLIHDGTLVAMFDRVTDQVQCDKVIADDFQGAYNATQHFIQNKIKKIAIISTIDKLNIGKLRIKGYLKALIDNHIPIDQHLIIKIDKSEDFETRIRTLLIENTDIDGLFVLEEISAVHILKIVKKMGYKVPEDLSIICFVNGLISKYTSPSLTTISQHGEYMGETVAQILISRLEAKESEQQFITKVVKTNLILRKSTKNINV